MEQLIGASTSENTGGIAFLDDGKNTIGSQLASRLREAIISGEIEAGSKINLDKARQSFNVSLSPLREGLSRLIPMVLSSSRITEAIAFRLFRCQISRKSPFFAGSSRCLP